MSEFKVGDVVWLKEDFLDVPAGTLAIIFKEDPVSSRTNMFALRPILFTSLYSKTGLWYTRSTANLELIKVLDAPES